MPARTVVGHIAAELREQIERRTLAPGTKLPSVRKLAHERRISTFSAAEIYNFLVAAGVVEARSGVGYFVAGSSRLHAQRLRAPEFPTDVVWELRRASSNLPIKVDAGCGWLPGDWLYGDGVRAALRAVARHATMPVEGYGNPLGLQTLRAHLSVHLRTRGIDAPEDQIVLTQGASQAIDLVVRECLEPGDAAIVEDPGFPPVAELLKLRGVHVLGVPRTQEGPDIDVLAKLMKRRRVRCLFTNTTCQNPTGTTTTAATAHRILELANRHGTTVIEDEIFADLAPHTAVSLASLDELRRVIYISSFSKTLSPSLRAGYVAASPALAHKLARAKVLSSLASSELLERTVLATLTDGHYRRHVRQLRERLAAAHLRVAKQFGERGVEPLHRPDPGPFLWAKLPSRDPMSALWRRALRQGVLLAPGELFRVDGRATPYWRFNVAHCEAVELLRFLDSL